MSVISSTKCSACSSRARVCGTKIRIERDGFAQDLIRLAKLSLLPLQRSDPLTFVTGEPSPMPPVALGLPHPLPQRLACAANLRCNGSNCRPLRSMIAAMLQHHAHRTFLHFRRIPIRSLLRHGSTLSSCGASGKPGAAPFPSPPSLSLIANDPDEDRRMHRAFPEDRSFLLQQSRNHPVA